MANKNKYTGDLFGINFIKCFDCQGTGEIDVTPTDSKHCEIIEDCETCEGLGEIEQIED